MDDATSKSPPVSGQISGQTNAPKDRVLIQAMTMAFGTFSSRILGLIRDLFFVAFFSRTVTDAWGVAFRLPNLFRRLLGEGSLSVSFIPIFVETRDDDTTGASAKNLVNSFYTLLLIILSALTAAGILGAPLWIKGLVDVHFSEIPGKFELTVRMAQIMFVFIFFMSTYAYFMGILNALGKFGWAAFAPTFFNVSMIIANFIPLDWQPVPGDSLAWGVVVGGFLQMIVLVPNLIRLGFMPRLQFRAWHPKVGRVLKNMAPGLLGMGLLQIMTIVNTRFAAQMGEGSNTAMYLCDRLLELPLSLVSVSLGTALLPTLAQAWSRNEKEHMLEVANRYFRINWFVAFPASLGLFFLGEPIVRLLFERGQFGVEDRMMTALVLKSSALVLLASSSVRVFVPLFYAIQNTWYPAVVSGLCLLLHLWLAPILMQEMGLRGLVLSTGFSSCFNFILLIGYARWKIGQIGFRKILSSLLTMAVAGCAFVAVSLLYPHVLSVLGENLIGQLLSLLIVGILCVAAYSVVCSWMKSPEFEFVFGQFQRKIKRKLGLVQGRT